MRVPLIFLLPIDVMVAVSEAMTIAVFAGLIARTLRYIRHNAATSMHGSRVDPTHPVGAPGARSR